MRLRLLLVVLLAAAMASCTAYPGPTATCFAKGRAPCDFQPVPGAEGGADGRP